MTYSDVINSSNVVLVEFYANWCPHCRRMMPVVEQIKELLDGRVPVYQFDIDENGDAAKDAEVNSVPTFIIYKDGTAVWCQSGEIDGEALLGKVENCM